MSDYRAEFSPRTKLKRWEFTKGCCEYCGLKIQSPKDGPEYHHEKEAKDGGDNSFGNCRVLCRSCHSGETSRFAASRAKSTAQKARHLNAAPAPRQKLQSRGFARREKPRRFDREPLRPRGLYEGPET